MPQPSPAELFRPVQLTPALWQRAQRLLLAKLFGEFAYEELIRPVAAGDSFLVAVPDAEYRFTARRGAYGSW